MAAPCSSTKWQTMPRETQNRILRVLVDQSFQRLGGSTKVQVDVQGDCLNRP